MIHAKALLRTALRLTPERTAAEDLVQETLLRAWRAFDQFEPGSNCKAWLFRILLNLSSRQFQKQRSAPPVSSLEELSSTAEPAAPAATADWRESKVFAALGELPEEQRVVILLAVVEGFTCKEMGRILEIPMGTVMSRLGRARKALREKLMAPEGKGLMQPFGQAHQRAGGMVQ